MKKNQKIKSGLLLALFLTSSSHILANDIKTELTGAVQFEYGSRKQKSAKANASHNNKNYAFDTSATFGLKASSTNDHASYGALIRLQTTTLGSSSTAYNGTHIFVESNYGKWQLGSDFDSATQMRLDGFTIARGSGNNWVGYTYFDSLDAANTQWAPTLDSPFSGKFMMSNGLESSRKVTYFTPKIMNAIQIGISYIPDLSNIGNVSKSSEGVDTSRSVNITDAAKNKTSYVERSNLKDGFSVAVSAEKDITTDVNIKVSATGQFAKSASFGTKSVSDSKGDIVSKSQYKVSGLRGYNIGFVLNYGPTSFAMSYDDFGKSLTSVIDGNAPKTKYYSAATAYNQGPVGVSLLYTRGQRLKNVVDSYTLGTDYKLASGLLSYAEVTYFKGVGRKLPIYGDNAKISRNGIATVVGAKVKF